MEQQVKFHAPGNQKCNMPRYPMPALIGQYEIMFCHLNSLSYKFKQSLLQIILIAKEF